MNGSFPRALLIAGCLLLSLQAVAEIRLVGVMREEAAVRVSLVDKENRTAAWVAIGESFMGFKVVAVSAKYDEVTLRRGASEQRVRLQNAVIEPYEDPSLKIREEQFEQARTLMVFGPDRKPGHPTIEEWIQLAAKFGRVVLRRVALPEQDVIVVGLPGTDSDPRGKDLMSTTNVPKDGSRGCTLLVR